MADLPSVFSKVNDIEVSQDTPVTEALFGKIGSDVNYLKDNLDAEITNRIADVNAEESARIAADAAIGTRISDIGVLAKYVSSGTYDTTGFLIAGAPIHVNFHCDGVNFSMEIWYTNANTADGVDFYVTGGNKLTRKTTVSLGVSWTATRFPVYTYNRNDGLIYWSVWDRYSP